ncbi:endonuclease domain-containing protein [Mesorhizobium sp. AR10]|uniref:endonuclease domain-containing protein n=1 Tax=Mesorhizobium sp. AR10 TaxID=2865839 RepID=UPI00216036FF
MDETEAEYRLWGELRGRHLNGYKFVRQVPLGPFIADFVCREKGLIVELDGSQHADSPTDPARTAWLNGRGYAVLRFWNHEVLAERSLTRSWLASMERFLPPHPTSASLRPPSPRWGEEGAS